MFNAYTSQKPQAVSAVTHILSWGAEEKRT